MSLSLNGYNSVDLCTEECNEAQLAWLKKDLAAVDRSKTPWVVAMSHFPMYLTVPANGSAPAQEEVPLQDQAWYASEECEYEGHRKECKGPPGWEQTHAKAQAHDQIQPKANADLEPIFYEYGVDIYWAGHIHFYNRFHGPVYQGRLVGQGTHNPKGTIHSCTGNGGPPSPSKCVCEQVRHWTGRSKARPINWSNPNG